MVPDLPQRKTNFNFYVCILQKYMHDGLKSIMENRIPVRFDPDLDPLKQFPVGMSASQYGNRILGYPPDLRILIIRTACLWMHCSIDCSLETVDLQTEKSVREP
jgi:hypothetical protein